MYRLDKVAFNELLELIKPRLIYSEFQERVAILSSGGTVSPLLHLAVTLRLLAGGSNLDISFGYHIHSSTIYQVFFRTLYAINDAVDNIQFPYYNEEKLREVASTFTRINRLFPGTVAAGDGVVFRMRKPMSDDVDGNVSSFFTRKGYYAYGMQGFVDGNCKFLHISMRTCSSTHDCTAYLVSGISEIIRKKLLPLWAHIVLDEAYRCTDQELSPWKGRHLPPDKDAFNYYLSLNRQVVERAFGLLVGRWGIFWRPLRFTIRKIGIIVTVCCKLHNICVDRFGSETNSFTVNASDVIWTREINPAPNSAVMWTDGTTVRRGTRTDLHTSSSSSLLRIALFVFEKARLNDRARARNSGEKSRNLLNSASWVDFVWHGLKCSLGLTCFANVNPTCSS
jgi:hypothetical protein